MNKLKKFFTAWRLDRGYKKWLKKNPTAMEENKEVLNEIGDLLGEKVSERDIFIESIEISPADHKTEQIVIRTTPALIKLLDKFLIDNGIIATKEATCLRVDYLP